MDSIEMIFGPALNKYTRSLLTRIAIDYNLNEAELVAKYAGSDVVLKKTPSQKKPRVLKADRPPCPGLTGKKTPCKNACLPGENTCHFHSGKPKVPKVLAPAPAPVTADLICQPCVVAEPEEVEMSIQDRLKMIIGEEELEE